MSNIDFNAANSIGGFSDPNVEYPTYTGESDASRLTRGDKPYFTIVDRMDASRESGVPIADARNIALTPTAALATWSSPPMTYATHYPYNKVLSGESGHAIEIDDTPNFERLNWFHKSGSYNQIDHAGTAVEVAISDKYSLLKNNRYTKIRCNEAVYVGGDVDLYVANNSNIRVQGNNTVNVGINCTFYVIGDMNVAVGGNMVAAVNGDSNVVCDGNITLAAEQSLNLKGSSINLDAGSVSINTGNLVSSVPLYQGSTNSVATPATPAKIPKGTPVKHPIEPQQMYASIMGTEYAGMKYYDELKISASDSVVDAVNAGNIRPSILSLAKLTTKQQIQASPKSSSVTVPSVITEAQCKSLTQYPAELLISSHAILGDYTANNYDEIDSQNGVDSGTIMYNIAYHATNIFDKVVELYPNVFISSGYRSINNNPTNNTPKGSHNDGTAADFVFPGKNRYEVAKIVAQLSSILNYDELYLCSIGIIDPCSTNHVWVHISTKTDNGNRGKIKTIHNNGQFEFDGIWCLNYDPAKCVQ